jgi:CheY-like chemotaxis protein
MDTTLNQEQTEYVVGIQRSSKSLLSIINDILDISKIEARKIVLDPVDMDLFATLQDVVFMFKHLKTGKPLEIRYENTIPPERRYIKADAGRFKQILVNLMGNATKFTMQGHVLLRAEFFEDVTLDEEEDNNLAEKAGTFDIGEGKSMMSAVPSSTHRRLKRRFKFSVVDTGIGIDEAQRKVLFKPFSQAESSTTRRFGGTGLGLSITKHMVILMGGNIDFESTPGKGSTFWFEIPYVEGDKNMIEKSVSTGGTNIRKTSVPTDKYILVAEDNPTNLTIALRMLEKMGIRAEGSENGEQTLKALEANPGKYFLVLMDCQMPVMDGYETSRTIRSNKGAWYENIPIIALTANALKGEREACLRSGMNDYMSKPFDKDVFYDKIMEWSHVALNGD